MSLLFFFRTWQVTLPRTILPASARGAREIALATPGPFFLGHGSSPFTELDSSWLVPNITKAPAQAEALAYIRTGIKFPPDELLSTYLIYS